MQHTDKIEYLSDVSSSGSERPWSIHKTSSLLLSESFGRLNLFSKAFRVRECGSLLKFNVCPHEHEKKLTWANFCRVRLCPMCAWRKSLLVAHQVKLVSHEVAQRSKVRWLFLTLTVENCRGSDLENTIDWMMKSFRRLTERKVFKSGVLGFFRSFEVTRNNDISSDFYDTYHPHFHVLLCVPRNYLTKNYINHGEWVQLWQDCLKVDYKPVVDIQIVKDKKRNVEREKVILRQKGIELNQDGSLNELPSSVVAETAKYSVKSSDYIIRGDERLTDRIVSTLDGSLRHKRFYSFGGLLKDVWKELKANDKVQDVEDENVDLVHVDDNETCNCSVCGSNMLETLYSWLPEFNGYIKKENNPE